MEKIKKARLANGYTQEVLAEKIDISPDDKEILKQIIIHIDKKY